MAWRRVEQRAMPDTTPLIEDKSDEDLVAYGGASCILPSKLSDFPETCRNLASFPLGRLFANDYPSREVARCFSLCISCMARTGNEVSTNVGTYIRKRSARLSLRL